MKGTMAKLSASCIALWGVAGANELAAADSQAPVITRNLDAPRTLGKVAAVIWTVRPERCTLQVVFPNAGRIAQAKQANPGFKPGRPDVQVWLLKGDGTLVPSIGRAEPGNEAGHKDPAHPYGVEILFAFPVSAQKEAVAAAIRIDGDFYVEPLAAGQ